MPTQADVQTSSGNSGGSLVFFHPDLGIGGAERLVVDAAVGLQNRGHHVVIFTNHCDPSHCFDECRDGTLDVRVYGDWLPMSIFNRLTILCAILRHVYLLLHITLSGELQALHPRAFIVDQLSAGLPLMRTLLAPNTPILFYCHFPDLLLVQGRQQSLIKRLYRLPFDWIEEWSMGFSQAVAVNSEFTKGVVRRTWPRLEEKVETKVVYPCVDTTSQEEVGVEEEEEEDEDDDDDDDLDQEDEVLFGRKQRKMILSINRFERKKNIGLAIKAFAAVPESERSGVRLVLAGGYDPRVAENVQYHTELQDLASSLSLAHRTITPSNMSALSSTPTNTAVLFLLSIPNSLKTKLLRTSTLLLYTPSNEHFGIVPLEAMLSRLPVLACNTGGPVETVRDGETGWLCDPEDVAAWSGVLRRVLGMSDDELRRMGQGGAERVKSLFGRDKMALRIETLVDEIVSRRAAAASAGLFSSLVLVSFLLAVVAYMAVYIFQR